MCRYFPLSRNGSDVVINCTESALTLFIRNYFRSIQGSKVEKAMAPHSSTLAWKIPGRLQSMGSRRVRQDWATSLSLFTFIGEGNGNPLQCSCLENPRDGEPGGLPSMGSQSRTRLKPLSSSSRDLKRLGKDRPFPGEFSGEAQLDLQGKRCNQLPAVSRL